MAGLKDGDSHSYFLFKLENYNVYKKESQLSRCTSAAISSAVVSEAASAFS